MAPVLRAKVTKRTRRNVQIEITRESFEAFCDAAGLYRKEFIPTLDASERDHRAGRVTKRKSLRELCAKRSMIEISTTATAARILSLASRNNLN
jgi:hypothetical protein